MSQPKVSDVKELLVKLIGFAIVLLCSLFTPSFVFASEKPLVLLIGIDGFRPTYLKLGVTPNLNELASKGVLAKGSISAFPSLTFPNFVSLVTGLSPDHHGIVNNTMTDSRTQQVFTLGSRDAVENPFWWSDVTPIWSTLRAQGGIASAMFWPGSEVEINGMRPNDYVRYDHGMSHERRLEILFSWLSRPESQRPNFATLYLSDVDSAGHEFGPESQELVGAVSKVDQTIGQLITKLKSLNLYDKTTLVIVSDHGMASTPAEKTIDVSTLLKDFPKITWEWQGATSAVRLNGENAQKVLDILDKQPHMSCYRKSNLPERFKFGTHSRIPDLLCLSELSYTVSANPMRKGPLGQHGFDPSLVEMHGLFLTSGLRVEHKEIGIIENLEIYPFLCHLLGIQEEKNDSKHLLINMLFK